MKTKTRQGGSIANRKRTEKLPVAMVTHSICNIFVSGRSCQRRYRDTSVPSEASGTYEDADTTELTY
jgi:hypothetical protein